MSSATAGWQVSQRGTTSTSFVPCPFRLLTCVDMLGCCVDTRLQAMWLDGMVVWLDRMVVWHPASRDVQGPLVPSLHEWHGLRGGAPQLAPVIHCR